MRCVAVVGLLALAGCNQVFGVGSTRGFDASPDVIADMPHVELTWQVARAIEGPAGQPNLGNPDPLITFPPISPAPQVRIGPLDGALGADPTSYSPDNGWIATPFSYMNTTWRLEYILADNIAREVQWTPEDKRGRLTVPILGRLDRTAVPSGSGYTITPSSVASFSGPHVLSTGLWTQGDVITSSAPTVDYDFSSASSLSGAKGRLERARGDRVLLVDYRDPPVGAEFAGCHFAVGAADFPADMLVNQHAVVTPTWDTRTKPLETPTLGLGPLSRLTKNLTGLLDPQQSVVGSIVVGRVASLDIPSFTDRLAGSASLLLPVPTMHTLVQCPYTVPLPPLLKPNALASFPIVEHVQLAIPRTILGTSITVASGIETLLTTVESFETVQFDVSFPAAFPTQVQLMTASETIDLVRGAGDHIDVGPVGTFTLSFVPETSTSAATVRSDYYDVLLYKVGASALALQRVYTVTAPTVRVDAAVLAPASEYIFEIRSYKGRPMAARGDFTSVDYPYSAAIVFTHTFKTS